MDLEPPAFDAAPHPEGDASGAPRRPRRPALTSEERRRADTRTVALLERRGFNVRPKLKTSLLEIATGIEHHLDETKARALFASHARQRAADIAKTFDAYSEQVDRPSLRLFGLRPAQGKAKPGTLAQVLRRLSADYNRYVGRLVSRGKLKPILSCIHIRYDIETGLYDPHIHVVCNVTDDDLDTVNIELARRFSDPWQEREPIKEPGALMNYLHLWMFNHREVALWPEEAIVEVWELPRVRLSRPAGPFAAFRREVKGKLLDRENGKIVVRERPAKPTRGTSRRRSVPLSDDEAHVVAIRDVRIGGQKRRCAIIKRPRSNSVQEPAPSAGRPMVVVPPVSARWLRRLRVYLDTALPMLPPVLYLRPLAKAVQVLARLWMVACLFAKVGPSARALPCVYTQVQSPRSLAPACEVEHRARGPPFPGRGGPLRARVSRARRLAYGEFPDNSSGDRWGLESRKDMVNPTATGTARYSP